MVKKQRRRSQNSRFMRQILEELREYDLDEIKLLVNKFRQRNAYRSGSQSSTSTRRLPKPTKNGSQA